ncbi:hypothetical protein GCM10007276_24030 [Agaricicola taiwanensis]|uniref:BioF2-like acetyltransferase domain-containing protein n=1 Tax=Agaricicola taiwanensis TaxID=591372 RepID=A0A8J2YIT2_9RHOB|nr:GNAT family N-acetyltransferase [Agaricicola taiwanensis]GGE46032.1 hypothetical protein GCM10007276_24030 [Agaricicola taiwanensis]
MSLSASDIQTAATQLPDSSRPPVTPPKSRILPWRDAAPMWREAEARGHLSPYQTWRWISAWNEEIEEPQGRNPIVLLIESETGDRLLLPLTLKKIGPARAAVVVGEDHANFKFPILSGPATEWRPDVLRSTIVSTLRKAGIDLLILDNMPMEWEGVPNPLAPMLTHQGPTLGFKTALHTKLDDYLAERLSHSHLKKHRQKERGLGRLAPLNFFRASTMAEVTKILDAFFQLKADRFAELGIPDVFRDEGTKAFMRRCATEHLTTGSPALVLYALTSGDRVVAIYGGCEHGPRFSGSVNAMALDSQTRRYSPGDILLLRLIGDCGERGFQTFDLGLGEASYKMQYCPEIQQVYDGVIANTGLGSIVSWLWHGWRDLKFRLKQRPALLARLQHIRRLLVR